MGEWIPIMAEMCWPWCDAIIQVWLNQGPTAPFMCPLPWIPMPFGMREGGIPTAIGGGGAGYIAWLCGSVWGFTRGLPAGLPLRCWIACIFRSPSSWIRVKISKSFMDSDSRPSPKSEAFLDNSSCSDTCREWIYSCKGYMSGISESVSGISKSLEEKQKYKPGCYNKTMSLS